MIMDSSSVAAALNNQHSSRPLGLINDIDEASEHEDILLKTAPRREHLEPKEIVDFDGLAKHLEKFITAECEKIKSILLTMTNRCDKILRAIEYKADLPQKTQVWREIGVNLPFDSVESFLEFEESLKNNEEKRYALMDIFKMVADDHKNYEDDVTAIMAKIILKNVQLQYSGCGKKVNGVGKKSFRDTETYKVMEEFLTAKYQDSKDKLKMVTAVSKFFSGANDRDGGRSQRNKQV